MFVWDFSEERNYTNWDTGQLDNKNNSVSTENVVQFYSKNSPMWACMKASGIMLFVLVRGFPFAKEVTRILPDTITYNEHDRAKRNFGATSGVKEGKSKVRADKKFSSRNVDKVPPLLGGLS